MCYLSCQQGHRVEERVRFRANGFTAVVTSVYLLYLFAPIILLVVGSFGESWTNSLLPSGITTNWCAELASDPSLQRAFYASLKVVSAVCLINTLITVSAISIGEFQFSNLVAGFLNRTYPILLLQAFSGATGFACAATVVLLGLVTCAGIASALTAHAARSG